MSSKDPFAGRNNPTTPFSEDENDRHREMYRRVSDAWPTIEGIDQISKGAGRLAKVVGVLVVLGAIAAYVAQRGLV